MGTQASGNASGPQGDSATVGLGGVTSGQEGATPTHETQQETGGSGGDQLTQSTGDIEKAPDSRPQQTPDAPQTVPEPEGSAMQNGARGAQDTRSGQAGGTGTGLGTPETGANQSEEDLPPAR